MAAGLKVDDDHSTSKGWILAGIGPSNWMSSVSAGWQTKKIKNLTQYMLMTNMYYKYGQDDGHGYLTLYGCLCCLAFRLLFKRTYQLMKYHQLKSIVELASCFFGWFCYLLIQIKNIFLPINEHPEYQSRKCINAMLFQHTFTPNRQEN
jgi:hypothetical protein